MTLITENGWPKIGAGELDRGRVPGTTQILECRAGDVSTVLKGWAAWYHRNVEPIDRYKPRDDWGWSATNEVADSNHLSGTAIDINATQYPWKRYTMPAERVAKVRRGLALFEGVIFWGRDWARPDEMHYQINGASSRVQAFAVKLRGGYLGIYGDQPVVAPAGRPTVQLGSTGQPVGDLQARLNRDYPRYSNLAVDGIFGSATDLVVREFQIRAGLLVDGIVGPATWKALGL